MRLVAPERGSIIRYAYLWADEHRRGCEEAGKERPALSVAISVRIDDATTEMLVLTITHSPPKRATDAVALPGAIKRRLGVNDRASWIVTTEANAFVWPGPDVRPIPGRHPPSVEYGRISDDLLQKAARSFLENRKRQRAAMILRSR